MAGQMWLGEENLPMLEIRKPIRLIELFAGYGSQALALKYLGVPFEHWHISEWAIPSILAYKDLHFPNDETDYSAGLTKKDLVDYLDGKISADYNAPVDRRRLERYDEQKLRDIYNAAKASRNVLSVTAIHAEDLNVVDTDRFAYILTYSFPCQDLSSAGKGAGMARGSGTRSGLLWEVERLLKEMTELPQVLLMENVPEVISQDNIGAFAEWLAFLESKGYTCKFDVINAKDQNVPQNRARCYMLSWLGEFAYDFPSPVQRTRKLLDVLEADVPESYYLTPERVLTTLNSPNNWRANSIKPDTADMSDTLLAGGGPTNVYHADGIRLWQSETGNFRAPPMRNTANTLTAKGFEGVIEFNRADGIKLHQSEGWQKGQMKDTEFSLITVAKQRGVVLYNGDE